MEFQKPLEATLRYRITTPMFLGGEGQQVDPHIFRTASLKSALRFWWRALNWTDALNACDGQQEAALKLLHQREGALFGSARDDASASQQSRVLLRCELKSCGILEKGNSDLAGVSYLLGQGLWHFRDKLTRQALKGDARLDVHITLKRSDDAEQDKGDMERVLDAAKALGCFGGLGSRARKGFGSLSLERVVFGDKEERFDNRKALEGFIATLPRSAPWDNAPLTAFTSGSQFHIGEASKHALQVLTAINTAMWEYRSWKSPQQHEELKQDHQTAYDIADGKKARIPLRAVFGLPHNYFLSSREPKAKVDFGAKLGSNELRRASPLFIHIHAIGSDGFVAVQTMLPAQFLPHGAEIEASPSQGRRQRMPFKGVDYDVIRRYIKRLDRKQGQGAHHA